jgi:PEGA domain
MVTCAELTTPAVRGALWAVVALLASIASHVAAQEAKPREQLPVLLLAPNQTEEPQRWADVVRGLHAAGMRATQVVELGIDPVWAACRSLDCAASAVAIAKMPVVLCSRSVDRSALELHWFGADGVRFALRTPLAHASMQAAAAALTQALRRRLALGDRAMLEVVSVPPGASVRLDGELVGLTPYQRPCAPGTHMLRVELDGRTADERRIQLSSSELHRETVSLAPNALATSSARRDAVSPANFALAGLLLVAATPALISGVNSALDDGQCLQSDAGGCRERGRLGPSGVALIAGGVVAAAGGLYLFIARPLRVIAEVAPRAAMVQVRGSL